jgi:tRNA (guanine-N7-)-methyltransferase
LRQRRIKNVDEKIRAHAAFLIEDPKGYKGHWAELIPGDGPLYIEIGCGKGKFITGLALRNKGSRFVGFEGHQSVALHALEKAESLECSNVHFVLQYVNGLTEIFDQGEIDGIYLNFSDPWPKARHEKRRLTCGPRLREYAQVLKLGGFIEFKTDNDGLFEYSVEEVRKQADMEIAELSRDLHADFPEDSIVTTEYEEKFAAAGKKINYVRIKTL